MKDLFSAGALVLALGLAGAAGAEDYKPLEAQYKIGSRTVLDPPAGEKKDRVYLWLSGEGAKAMYEAMPGKALKDYCGEDGASAKQAGGLLCTKSRDGEASCSVAITLDRGRTAPGSVC